ncbi:testis-expressed protein 2 isoform X1 [Strongylocentrotus purpuratus]|uniref:SMP-LTD domain-containing protein n=1 Tax=Strongylocentrotus purpuratus TaxID=7668 RepID=A0A7M7P8E8_STRPU|nr:testis-expressed protein 2 isoform X1 [Strongylocentrotus purpuratus]
MSTEKKPKPPRPPAPNLAAKKSIKKQASSGLSFSFNDLKAVDSDEEDKSFARFTKPERDDPLSDPTKIKEMKPLTNTNHDLKTKEMKPLTHSNNGATSGEFRPLQKEDKDSSFEDIFDAVNRLPSSKPIAVSKPVTEQVKKVQEEVKRTRSSPPRSSGNTENRESDGIKNKPKLQKGGSGILRVATEVLEEKENESYQLPSDSQEALADPLSFLDKVMEDQLESSFDDDDNVLEKGGHVRKRRQSGNGKKKVLQQQPRTKSLDADINQSSSKVEHEDSMDINPCYFNVPTPAELKDEPTRRPDSIPNSRSGPKSQAKGISLSGLLASPDITEEDNDKPSTNVNSDGFRTPDMPPDDTDWVTIEKKPHAGTSSPPPSSNQLLSPEEENKTVKATPQGLFPSLPFYTLYTLTFLTFLYFMFPLPTYITGFLTGLLCSFYLVLFLIWMNLPPTDKSFKETEGSGGGPPLVIPGPRLTASKIRSKEQEKVTLKGWMNELTTPYDPETYHVNQTHSIYVRLEGHSLRLSKPKQNIARRSMFDEPTPRPEFIHQRIYDIRGSHVYLQPEGLVKKRLWSKKYPLFIELPKKGISVEKKDVSPPDDEAAQGLGFDVIKKDECDDKVLVLFARTGREKEEWFWKFEAASLATKVRPIQTLHKKVFLIGNDIIGEDGNPMYRVDPDDMTSRKSMVDFYKFLAKVMPKEKDVKELLVQDVKAKAGGVTYASPGRRPGKSGSEREMSSIPGAISNDAPVAWVNAFIGRFFWDFLREQQWADLIQTKLQKKLSKLKIPHFMEALTITGTDLGLNAPTIRKASKPTVDSRGMWVDLEMHYGGSCWMTLSTKFNLWKLGKDTRMEREMEDLMSGKKEGIEKLESTTMYSSKTGSAAISNKKHALGNPGYPSPTTTVRSKDRRQMSAALDSEEEDSAESSDDEVAEETNSTTSSNDAGLAEDGTRSSSKILRFVNKVANSNYFQRATQNKYVKRAFNEVSNTAVELTVEVKELRGVLTVNIPPPPSDRVWYGFRGKPHLWLSAKPKLGTRQVTITHITEYIEKKLEKEFQRVFVLPNMDDIPMPIMNFDVEEHRFAR